MTTRTKSDIIKEFAKNQMELDYHLEDQAEEMGLTALQLAVNIAETEFEIGLSEGTIVKVGRRYKVL